MMKWILPRRLTVAFLRSGLVAAVAALTACSSSTSTSPTPAKSTLPVSESAIQTIVTNFARGATNAANTSSSTSSFNSFAERFLPRALTTIQVNEPFSQRTNCQVGGYHETSGRVTGTIDTSGNGVSRLQMNSTTTIHDYGCMATGWLVNGDPYISGTGEIRITGSSAAFDFSQSLGWKARETATGASFSCQHHIKVTWDTATNGRVQGYVDCSPPVTTVNVNLTF
jgi:hypothetical protein